MDAFSHSTVDYSLGRLGPEIDQGLIDDFIDANVTGSGTALQEDGVDGEAYNVSAVASAHDYLIEEDVYAAYIMSRVDINDLRLVYGLRYEGTKVDSKGYDARLIEDSSGVFSHTIEEVTYDKEYHHVLPSINARYRLTDELLLRAAYSETIARPSFGDITPSPEDISIEEDELKVEAGNPDLDPYESSNFDLIVEYYPGDIGVVSASVFYKKIDNFIFSADVSDVIDSSLYAPGVTINDSEIYMPMNGNSADLYGLELAYTKNFDSGFLIQANATFTNSDADLGLETGADRSSSTALPEQADTVGNLVLGYETGPFSLRLSTNYKSKTLMELDLGDKENDTYADDHMQVDFSARYDISKSMQMYFSAINLTDEPMYLYQGSRKYNSQYEEYGSSFVLGFTYRNF